MQIPDGMYVGVVNLTYLTDIADHFPQTKFEAPILGWPMKPYTNGNDLLLTFPRANSTITHEIFTKHFLGNTWTGLLGACKIGRAHV